MATTYLTKTPSGTGSTSKATISVWVKRSDISITQDIWESYNDGSNYFRFRFRADNRMDIQADISNSTVLLKRTVRKFRDTSAWYHIVIKLKLDEASDVDKVKLYINGVEETNFTDVTNLSSTSQQFVGGGGGFNFTIGRHPSSDAYFNGSMSHFHFVDGTAYDASAFGETDATTGEWKIKTSPSVTYGTNGFFILKDGNSVTDQSGNSNNFTVGGGTLTNTEDCPDNVFATLNALLKPSDYTLSQGNNTIAYGSSSSRACCLSTLGMSSGKFYAELKITATSTTPCQGSVGIANNSDNTNSGYYPSQGNSDNAASYQFWDGTKNVGTVGAAYGNTVAANDIMGFAFDIDNKAMYVSKNGVWQASGVPTSGASKTNAIDFSSITDNGFWFLIVGDGSGVQTFTSSFNFGNGYFGTTAISSEGSNASGIGKFEYDVPTGFTALSTKGLNT